ncbi:MAG: hybrid sensor histidine kinase/response regulator [Rhizobiaceae bacterium]|nr:hybrid sensor histidine kinase/response regulator [Rhizobiaceae bacterium]MCV0409199.1 hybrid sensor histidine kinase/response regulator [Rhizobiaceae bacterium]
MTMHEIDDVERLKRINAALMGRVERSMDQQGSAFTLFQTAITLDRRIRQRTDELTQTLRRLEQSNRELAVAKETAEQANLSKTRFLAAASHDVLQPLNAAHLSVSALADLQTSEEGRRLAAQVGRALETMDDLLRTLLDISRLDAGVVKPEIVDVPLRPLFQSLWSDFSPMAAKQRLELRFRDTDEVVRTDRTMYRRVLQNIISNALRYTRQGGVLVGARRRGGDVVVQVVDTGIGIPPDQHEAVYEEFHRGAGAVGADPRSAGLGLGLAIVRRMVQALGHRIELTSHVGRGTIFRVVSPAVAAGDRQARAAAASPVAPRVYGLYGIRVLLLENDAAVSEAMTSLLARWHCDVRFAASRGEAFARLATETDWRPDIIVADQHLDHGDLGTRTVEALRETFGRRIPALLVTADASDAVAATARASGIELMRKPVKPAELRALIAHLLA